MNYNNIYILILHIHRLSCNYSLLGKLLPYVDKKEILVTDIIV